MSDPDFFDYRSAWQELRQYIRERELIMFRPPVGPFGTSRGEAYRLEEFTGTRKRVVDIEAKYVERARQETRTREILAEVLGSKPEPSA